MTLADLFKLQKENEEKYNFVIDFKGYDIINNIQSIKNYYWVKFIL